MTNKVSFFDQLNNFGFGLFLATIGSISYLFIKGIKKLLDMLCEALMEKYTKSVRSEAKEVVDAGINKIETSFDKKFVDIRGDIKDIKENMKTEKERNHDSIAKNEGVLSLALETISNYDKKLNEETIINIPTSKLDGSSKS